VVFSSKLSIVDAGAHASIKEAKMPHTPEPTPKVNLLHYDAHLAILGTELLTNTTQIAAISPTGPGTPTASTRTSI
jgi:hypothetical protein